MKEMKKNTTDGTRTKQLDSLEGDLNSTLRTLRLKWYTLDVVCSTIENRHRTWEALDDRARGTGAAHVVAVNVHQVAGRTKRKTIQHVMSFEIHQRTSVRADEQARVLVWSVNFHALESIVQR